MTESEGDRICRMVLEVVREVTKFAPIPGGPEPSRVFVHPADRKFVRGTA